MVDIYSISADGIEKSGGKASQGGGSQERDAFAFRSALVEAQLKMFSPWLQPNANSAEQIDLFKEYRIILDQVRQQQGSKNPPLTPPLAVNPQLVAKSYEVEAARILLDGNIGQTANSPLASLPGLASLIGNGRGVPGNLFQQLIQMESGFNPDAVGSRGGLGLGQLLPQTAGQLGLRVGEDRLEGSVWHPASNLDASARYLRSLYDQFVGQGVSPNEAWKFSTGAYNAGPENINRAMQRTDANTRAEWDQVARELSKIIGPSAREVVEYVKRLQ